MTDSKTWTLDTGTAYVGSVLQAGQRAPCQGENAHLFFAADPRDLEQAKSLCGDCPARAACLAGAIQRREPWGVWGGEVFDGGVVVPRKRPRGRPRKSSRVGYPVAALGDVAS